LPPLAGLCVRGSSQSTRKRASGRPPVGVERMLRMYFLQHWFNLSDPAVEEALYDSPTLRAFVGIDLGQEPVPDETTVCKFRHLLEQHGLGQGLFDDVTQHLRAQGLAVSTGTIVDATIIAAPSSTKNATGTRDPAMHQTQKGRQWYFGMKGHFGVDSQSKLVHSVEATPANIHDSHVLPWLLHGQERRLWGDSAYAGQAGVLRSRLSGRPRIVRWPTRRCQPRAGATSSQFTRRFVVVPSRFRRQTLRSSAAATSRNASRCRTDSPSPTRAPLIPITAPRATAPRFGRSPRRSRSRVTSRHSLTSLRIAAWARSASSSLIPNAANSSITLPSRARYRSFPE
jgi:IS5 family transposase